MSKPKTAGLTPFVDAFEQEPTSSAPEAKPQEESKSTRPPSRQNKRMIACYAPPEMFARIRQLALDNETTVQALMLEAINDLLLKKNRPRVKV